MKNQNGRQPIKRNLLANFVSSMRACIAIVNRFVGDDQQMQFM
jgi:hypothetical protein